MTVTRNPLHRSGRAALVSAANTHSCGPRADGRVACWGDNGFGQAPAVVPGPFTQVSGEPSIAAGSGPMGSSPAGAATGRRRRRRWPFVQVSAGGNYSCGLRADGTVACWGFNGVGQATPPASLPFAL